MPAGESWLHSHVAADLPPAPTHDMHPSSAQPLSPLLSYYSLLQRPPPPIRFLPDSLLPIPYAQLLAHSNNMPPTLSAFHRSPLHLRVLHQSVDSATQRCTRFVRLLTHAEQCVEFGSIVIELDALPADVRAVVLSGVRPFGAVLLEAGVKQLCAVSGFIQVEEDDVIREAMGEKRFDEGADKRVLYGRCNVISGESGRVIARVVEILPPVQTHDMTDSGVGTASPVQ